MHRAYSLNYKVVLEGGEVELELDSGEGRMMRRGDIELRRARAHVWRNTSEMDWARMMYVMV